MSPAQAFVVANPFAGRGRAREIAEASVRDLATHGVTAELLLPTDLPSLRTALTQAAADGPTTLIACGGDGTVHQVLQAAVPADCVLGVIPAGTGNDNARSMGIPSRRLDEWTRSMAAMIKAGTSTRVDVALVSVGEHREWSLGVTSTGFDSAVNERADRMHGLNGTPRYVAALLGELRDFRTHEYVVTIDGEVISGRALLVAVGNGPNYGGGMRICPAADMTDGLLDVTWVDSAPRRTILRVFPRIFSGRHIEHPLVRTYRGREIVIDAQGPVVYADGDRVGSAPVRIEAVPGALRVLAPGIVPSDAGRLRT